MFDMKRREFITLIGGVAAGAAAGGVVIGFSLEALGFRSQP
jgi:hypothetical protein